VLGAVILTGWSRALEQKDQTRVGRQVFSE
jgi:hypothetical protein